MKKLNRILSAAVAACMSLTMFAGAAELDSAVDAPETETLTGTATIITEDGVTDDIKEKSPLRSNAAEQESNGVPDLNLDNINFRTPEELFREINDNKDEHNQFEMIQMDNSRGTSRPSKSKVKMLSNGAYSSTFWTNSKLYSENWFYTKKDKVTMRICSDAYTKSDCNWENHIEAGYDLPRVTIDFIFENGEFVSRSIPYTTTEYKTLSFNMPDDQTKFYIIIYGGLGTTIPGFGGEGMWVKGDLKIEEVSD